MKIGIAILGMLILAVAISTMITYLPKYIPSPSPTPIKQTTATPTPTPCVALRVDAPKPNTTVLSPLFVSVVVDNSDKRCHWTVFEAQAGTLELVDGHDVTIGTGILKTTDDWTTEKAVTYSASIPFDVHTTSTLELRIHEENPSGKENPKSISIPLNL